MTRAPRPRRSILFATVITALLALPAGIVLAADSFNDVPNSNQFHADINALVDAGVTAGCGNGNYCPKANVTREQMAAFMNRLGALAPGKTPVVNADRVDGRHANELSRVALASSGGIIQLTGAAATVLSVTVTAPGPGLVHVMGTVTAYSFDAACGCEVAVVLSDSSLTGVGRQSVKIDGDGANIANVAAQWIFEVPSAGAHTFHLRAWNFSPATGDVDVQFRQLTATYTPFGSAGGTTLGVLGPVIEDAGQTTGE